MIPMTCTCGKTIGVKDEHAGRRIRCPQCQAKLDVPIPELAGLVATDDGAALPPAAPQAPAPVVPTVAERLDALERENIELRRRCGRLRWGGIGGIAAAALLGMAPGLAALTRPVTASPPKDDGPVPRSVPVADRIEVGEIRIKDRTGVSRVSLGTFEDDVAGLVLRGANKHAGCALTVDTAGLPQFQLFDADGRDRLCVSIESGGLARIDILDRAEKGGLVLGTTADGIARVDMFDADHHPRGGFLLSKDGSSGLAIVGPPDQAGKIVLYVPDSGEPGLTFIDPDGKSLSLPRR